ncbi:MAG: hypothetical protein QOI80_2798 [Solirubrobacteraceae bacterium]|nr:hypothetical protein [Solirubrobacteraceae bacterium]
MTSDATAVTVSFADAEHGWFGRAYLGAGSALAVLFRGGEVAGVMDGATLELTDERVTWTGADAGFDLALEPTSAPIEHAGGTEQLIRVHGTAHADGVTGELDGVGQRGEVAGARPGYELVRGVSAWLGDGGIVLEALRPEGAEGHDAETVWAMLVEDGEPVPVTDPRLSTTYDAEGHQRRAGMELWLGEEGYPLRAAGEVICGSSLDLGELTLDLAFFRWRAEGTEGVGRYDILRRNRH